jgi:futalosine hydrolase
MNCLLAAATANEIAPFITYYRNGGNKQDIDILITGIGLTAAAYSLTKQINIKRPGLIIQAGIAGCFDKNLSLGSVVVITQDTIADQGVIENKQLKTMFDLRLIKSGPAPFKKNWLVNSNKELIRQTGLKAVKAVSVNQVTTYREMAEFYQQKFKPVVETMEGAALHYVCGMEKIPFLQIRALSNYIGERDKKKWNIKEAINNLNAAVINIIDIY